MSLLLFELDTETKVSRLIEKNNISSEDMCSMICNYFGFKSIEDLLNNEFSTTMTKKTLYKMCRQFISYFLVTENGLSYKEVEKLLGYKSGTSNISYNIRTIQEKILKDNESKIENHSTTYRKVHIAIMDPYMRSYNNLLRLITRFNIKENE